MTSASSASRSTSAVSWILPRFTSRSGWLSDGSADRLTTMTECPPLQCFVPDRTAREARSAENRDRRHASSRTRKKSLSRGPAAACRGLFPPGSGPYAAPGRDDRGMADTDDPSGPDPRPVRGFRPDAGADLDTSAWPATVPAVGQILSDGLELPGGLTILVGENGSGKSTVIEMLAEAYGLNPQGGSALAGVSAPGSVSRAWARVSSSSAAPTGPAGHISCGPTRCTASTPTSRSIRGERRNAFMR